MHGPGSLRQGRDALLYHETVEAFLERARPLHAIPIDGPRVRAGGVAIPALLDTTSPATVGDHEITAGKTAVEDRPGILITGYDLRDLVQLLEQSRSTGVDISTCGEMLPANTLILTAGCAEYRYNSLDLGEIADLPRVVDVGQCNDCDPLVAIARAPADAFGVGLNDRPIPYSIAWYEQKAVLVPPPPSAPV